MEWMFLVTASNCARVESRLLQVLDHHMVSPHSFASVRTGNEARVSFIAEADQGSAIRIGNLLRKLHDVQSVDFFANQDGLCRTLALFRILCDQESRLPLLQVIASLGAHVVAVRPDSVVFQIIGTLKDIEGLRYSLMPYGLLEAISVASAVVRKEPASATMQREELLESLVGSGHGSGSDPLPEIAELLPRPRKQEPVLSRAVV